MVQSSGTTILSTSTISSNYYCKQFAIPSSHYTSGYNADFLLYVGAAPTSSTVLAWASSCSSSASTRPTAGVTNVAPAYIADDTETVRTVAHEILHALGFSTSFFQTTSVSSLRGKTNVAVLATSNVVSQAQAFYGCASQSFMELEDEGGSGTAGSHWKRRSAKDEIMAGIIGVSRYSRLTIAAMEDLGFYKGVYSKGEYMAFGNGVGCTLTNSKCITNSVSNVPSMFCTTNSRTASGYSCPSDRLAIGTCYTSTSCGSVPSNFQYFTGNTLCGLSGTLTDYCPIVTPYSNTGCMDGDITVMPGSYITSSSRCFDASSTIETASGYAVTALCAAVKCGTGNYSIRLSGSDSWIDCPPSTTVDLSSQTNITSGSVTCPAYGEVCFSWNDEASLDPDDSSASEDQSIGEESAGGGNNHENKNSDAAVHKYLIYSLFSFLYFSSGCVVNRVVEGAFYLFS
ncbi:leishmanolysin [Strigomonas culicis]|uniref:Leishmanolysin-like peptidase n=1 Tax=Strigomonas culicis TaxID=28005 RepID=S9WBA0_9TRYP|nr:leishmanolysin [Strigomonas culicis]|eukprot:EPY36381.1 leishmanolysin [Strigomonas culicis]